MSGQSGAVGTGITAFQSGQLPYDPYTAASRFTIIAVSPIEMVMTAPSRGTIARFGWKAQNKSLLLFAAEAYNVEMGIFNELFPTVRQEKSTCQFQPTPNDFTDPAQAGTLDLLK